MNCRERENETLAFNKKIDRGAVQETFYPWNQTIKRFKQEDIPNEITEGLFPLESSIMTKQETIFYTSMADPVYRYEKYLGFDGVKRITFNLPFSADYRYRNAIRNEDDWKRIKEWCYKEIEQHYTNENISNIYGMLKSGHERGEYSIRANVMGFFWMPRVLMGDEEHLFAYYDYPAMLHDMSQFLFDIYSKELVKAMEVLPADVLYIQEDLSGKNGPMIAPSLFDEFIGEYYKKLIPVLKKAGVKNIFVDTDGDFKKLIPNFISSGVDGFLPVDVNAGMDIVKVREEFPSIKLIGGYNKLCIAEGKDAIDKEFERLMPVIAQGGFIPGCDHQVAPSTSLDNYKYYIKRLKDTMIAAYN